MATDNTGRSLRTGALLAACAVSAALTATASGKPPASNPRAPVSSLSVRPPNPDLNGDGVVDSQDLMELIRLQRSGALPPQRADINRDGAFNAADLGALIELIDDTRPPNLPDPPAPKFSSRLITGNKLEMTDLENNFFLILPTATRLWLPVNGGPNPSLVTPTIDLIPHPDGCDVVFTFNNTTGEWSGLGKITVAGVRFGHAITGHDFRFDGKPITLNSDNTGIGVSGWFYPGGTYSPVNVLEDGDYKLGVSLIYPVLDYKHQVKIRSKAQFPTGGVAWFTEFTLNANDENKYNPAGDLAPGEVRAYVVAVRAVKGARPWQETLEPYRQYFRSTYGNVRYSRDPRPAQFSALAVDGNHEVDNPYGFAGGYNLRPDLFGFRRWVDRLVDRVDRGYTRIMVSKPTGQFYVNRQNNIPTLFASHWFEGAEFGHAMGDAVDQFKRIPQTGLNLGLWWGRAAQVMPDGWDSFRIENLDPNNPEHVMLGFRELDAAYAAGARTIGLDAFRKMQAWDAIQWLQMMQHRAPGVRFITEPVCGDVVHNFTPAFQVATRPASEASLRVETRHFLADLLNPGHEIWGFIRIDRLADYLGRTPTLEDWIYEAERVASLGYIASVSEPISTTPGMVAAETWRLDE
ncbi:MAG: hypothetical protein IBJ10_07720 [Phycisphaerales bacterium]|nr:hypothetical protein [Phycisphaerales bacterium]